jgi:tetratricopeptide (TPR) repeat protein
MLAISFFLVLAQSVPELVERARVGGCESARPALEKAFAANTGDDRRLAGLALAQCDIAKERYAEAWPVVEKLREAHPADADVLYLAAKLHLRGWNDVVYQMFQKTPGSFRVNQVSAEIFEIQGRFGDAAGEYRKAIEKAPGAVNLHYRLGRALLLESHDNFTAAIREFEAELQLNPSDAAAEYQIGQILVASQKSGDAAARFEKAARLDPQFIEPVIALSKIRMERKQYPAAVELLEKAVAQAPRNEAAHYNLMLAYRNAGRAADARKQKEELDKLQKPPEGEFTEFLKKLGEKPPSKQP